MKTVFGATLLAIGLAMPTTAKAGCTLGVKNCQGGYWYVCQTCGSETCMIMSGVKCHKPGIPNEDRVTYSPIPNPALAQMNVAEIREKSGQ